MNKQISRRNVLGKLGATLAGLLSAPAAKAAAPATCGVAMLVPPLTVHPSA